MENQTPNNNCNYKNREESISTKHEQYVLKGDSQRALEVFVKQMGINSSKNRQYLRAY